MEQNITAAKILYTAKTHTTGGREHGRERGISRSSDSAGGVSNCQPGLDAATAKALVDAAEKICPYSKAIRGNVRVEYNIS